MKITRNIMSLFESNFSPPQHGSIDKVLPRLIRITCCHETNELKLKNDYIYADDEPFRIENATDQHLNPEDRQNQAHEPRGYNQPSRAWN